MTAVSVPQATHTEPASSGGTHRASPIGARNDEFVVTRHGLHRFALANRDLDFSDLVADFDGARRDAETGESVSSGGFGDSHRWLRHRGTGLRLDLRRTVTGTLLGISGTAACILAEDNRVDDLVLVEHLRRVEHAVHEQVARKGITSIVAKGRDALLAHPCFVKEGSGADELELRARMHWPGDSQRIVDLAIRFMPT